MSGNHDLGYKQLFAHPEMVRDLLAGFTPLACFQGLDSDAFERVNASYLELSDFAGALKEVIATLSVWLAGAEQAPLRRSIASWIKRLQERESPRLAIPDVLSLLEDETMGERFQRKYATWEDAIEDRGRQKGLEKGREEGRTEAMRSVLKTLLMERFGELPSVMAARIDQAGEAQAERWIGRVLAADSIDAVLRN